MKAIFMGTPDFAVPALEQMINNNDIDVCLVVTKEDKPKGRGKKVSFTEIKEVAIKHDIEVFNPKRIKDSENIEYLRSFNPDVIVVVAYGQILSNEILDIPKYGCINIHGSILPKYRGPAPIHRAIINGDSEVGVTIMYMNEGLDTGDIINTASINISDDETTGQAYDKLKNLGADLLIKTLKDFENGIFNREKQDDSQSCYAPLIIKTECQINFDDKANNVKNFIRGLYPFPKAFTYLDDVLYKIGEVAVINGYESDVPGKILEVTKDSIIVSCKESAINIKKIQKQGSKQLETSEFLKGNKLEVGQIFTVKGE